MKNHEFYSIISAINMRLAGWLQSGICYSLTKEKHALEMSEGVTDVFVNEIDSLLTDIRPLPICAPVVTVEEMKTSVGSDFYVMIVVNGRDTTPFKFSEEYKAQYEAAHFRYIFFGGDQPDLMEYGPDKWPGRGE